MPLLWLRVFVFRYWAQALTHPNTLSLTHTHTHTHTHSACTQAVIDGSVLCVHGGLSPDVRTLDQVRMIDRVCEIPHEGPFCDLMWSDPEDIESWAVSPRGHLTCMRPRLDLCPRSASPAHTGWLFGGKVATEFNAVNGLELICRAHQLVQVGVTC